MSGKKANFSNEYFAANFSYYKIIQENYHGIALNNGTCTQCQCGRHGKSCDHKTGKCSCTTKGITGNQCNQVSIKRVQLVRET